MKFLYQFVPGVTLSSFGVGVAEMAGMLPAVLLKAEKIAQSFNANININYGLDT